MKATATEQRDLRTARRAMMFTGLICAAVVVMLAFLLRTTYKAAEMEAQLKAMLPQSSSPQESLDVPPEEYFLEITAKGEFLLNEGPLAPEAMDLRFKELNEEAAAAKTVVYVTILAEEQAPFGCVVEAMDALKRAKISDVNFIVGTEEF